MTQFSNRGQLWLDEQFRDRWIGCLPRLMSEFRIRDPPVRLTVDNSLLPSGWSLRLICLDSNFHGHYSWPYSVWDLESIRKFLFQACDKNIYFRHLFTIFGLAPFFSLQKSSIHRLSLPFSYAAHVHTLGNG